MNKLTVIEGGQGTKPVPARKTEQEILLNLIFQTLPADTFTQIVTRINRLTSKRYNKSQVVHAITYLRAHAREYQWTIPHAKRGAGFVKGRYFAAVVNADGSWHTDPGTLELLHEGNRGTLSEIANKAEHNATAIEIYATQVQSQAVRKLLRRLARDQRHIGEQARDLSEELTGT